MYVYMYRFTVLSCKKNLERKSKSHRCTVHLPSTTRFTFDLNISKERKEQNWKMKGTLLSSTSRTNVHVLESIVITRLQFLFTLAVVAARPSHFTSLEGHGLASEPKLISESVHLKEIPTKIIKVTKTAVVKVPVPYPVKVQFSRTFFFFFFFSSLNSKGLKRRWIVCKRTFLKSICIMWLYDCMSKSTSC